MPSLAPPPFKHWAESVAWEERLIRDGCPLEALADELLTLNRPVPLTRAAILLNRLRDEGRRDDALKQAHAQVRNLLEHHYVFAVSYATRRGRAMLLTDDSEITMSDLLQQYLAQVRCEFSEAAEVSRSEVEYRLLEALHYDSMATGDHAQAIVTAKEMVLLSTVAQVPEIQERARRYYRSTVALAGRYHEDLTERLKVLQRLTPADDAYVREKKGLAVAQLNLGDLDGAWATAQQEPALPIHATVIQAFRGVFSSNETADSAILGDQVIGWIALCLRRLAEIDALPPWQEKQRRTGALTALAVVQEQKWRTGMTDRPFIAWLEAKCRLELGEYGLARHALNDMPMLEQEDLLTRTLVAGMQLELALTDRAFQIQSVIRSEQEIRSIFEYARTLRYGSSQGLAEVFRRWHPRPAAYMAVCPSPVSELLPAAEAILRCHQKAEAYGVILPPVTTFNEFQRTFGQSPDRSSLSSNARFQYGKLAVRRGDLSYWRPVVIAAQLIIALAQAQTPAHQHMAVRLTAEYGLIPEHLSQRFEQPVQHLSEIIHSRL